MSLGLFAGGWRTGRLSPFHAGRDLKIGRICGGAVIASGVIAAQLAWAQQSPPQVVFEQATQAVQRGSFNEAIAQFEQLSDQGVAHANTSFNRALAYLQRAESKKAHSGDMGQAVAGFREAELLNPGDEEARLAVEQVRQAIARQRSQQGLDPVVIRPSLGRAALKVVPETAWAVLALLGSSLLAAGLVLREFKADAMRRLSGQVALFTGLTMLLLCASLTYATRQLRHGEREAVVVVSEARMLDADGAPLKSRALDVDATAIPEGASVFASAQHGRLVEVQWGSTDAWVLLTQLRFVEPEARH